MLPETKTERLKNSFQTLGVAFSRHKYSLPLSRPYHGDFTDKQGTEGLAQQIRETGCLSPEEINLCQNLGMVLPSPCLPELGNNYAGPDLWNFKVEQEIAAGKVVYVLTGVFDVFTGGHWLLVHCADLLARSKEMLEDWGQGAGGQPLPPLLQGWEPKEGVVFARIESDEYVRQVKRREPIFPALSRAGWFEDLPVDWVSVYPTSQAGSTSWEFGNELLTGWSPNVDMEKSLVFVLPEATDWLAEEEVASLSLREAQIRDFGFGVIKVPAQISDVSTTKLIDRFSLKPVRF